MQSLPLLCEDWMKVPRQRLPYLISQVPHLDEALSDPKHLVLNHEQCGSRISVDSRSCKRVWPQHMWWLKHLAPICWIPSCLHRALSTSADSASSVELGLTLAAASRNWFLLLNALPRSCTPPHLVCYIGHFKLWLHSKETFINACLHESWNFILHLKYPEWHRCNLVEQICRSRIKEGVKEEKRKYWDFYSKTDFPLSFATKLVDECLPDTGDHSDVDDGVQHAVEEGEGQGPVEPLGGQYGDAVEGVVKRGVQEDEAVWTNRQKEKSGQEHHLDCNWFQRSAKNPSGNVPKIFLTFIANSVSELPYLRIPSVNNGDMSIYAYIYRFWALMPVYIMFSWPDQTRPDRFSPFLIVSHHFSLFLIVSNRFSSLLTVSHCSSLFNTVSHPFSLFLTISHCFSPFLLKVPFSFSPFLIVSHRFSSFLTIFHCFS